MPGGRRGTSGSERGAYNRGGAGDSGAWDRAHAPRRLSSAGAPVSGINYIWYRPNRRLLIRGGPGR